MEALQRSRPAGPLEQPARVQLLEVGQSVPVRELVQVLAPKEQEQEPLQVRVRVPGLTGAEVVQPPVVPPEVGAESAPEEKE